jgi:ribosomal protein L16/L10AE
MELQVRWMWHDNVGLRETEQSGIRQKYEAIEAARSAANTCLRKLFPE